MKVKKKHDHHPGNMVLILRTNTDWQVDPRVFMAFGGGRDTGSQVEPRGLVNLLPAGWPQQPKACLTCFFLKSIRGSRELRTAQSDVLVPGVKVLWKGQPWGPGLPDPRENCANFHAFCCCSEVGISLLRGPSIPSLFGPIGSRNPEHKFPLCDFHFVCQSQIHFCDFPGGKSCCE